MARIEQLEDRSLLSGAGLDDYERVSPDWFVSVVGSRAAEAAGLAAAADVALDRWIVRLSPETLQEVHGVQQVARILNRFDASFDVLRGLGLPGQVLVTSTLDPSRTEAALAANPCVASFELDTTVSAQDLTPSDPLYADQWGLAKIDAPAAWDVTRGSATVVVAVVDSGIDATHPDLYRNIWLNQGEIPSSLPVVDTDGDGLVTFVDLNNLAINGSFVRDRNSNGFIDAQDLLADPRWANGYDDDQNGFIDDLYGWDFVNYDPNPADDVGHGTHVAGTIGAMGNNRNGAGDWVGGAGVAWDTSLMSLKFLDANNQGSISAAIEATNYITMMRTRAEDPVNVRVSNNSWGQSGGDSLELKAAIEAAGEAGVLFVAAAGNGNILGQGVNNDLFPFYPASFDSECIVSVAATGPSDDLASFSNYGAESVDIAAPGVGIWSTKLGGGYASMDGTSMATPLVSGVAALVWSRVPYASVAEVRTALLSGGDELAGLEGRLASARRLNAAGALDSSAFAPRAKLVAPPVVNSKLLETAEITVEYTDCTPDLTGFAASNLVVMHEWGDDNELTVIDVTVGTPVESLPGTWVYRVAYEVDAPNLHWDVLDYGDYRITLQPAAVWNSRSCVAVAGADLGSFCVEVTDADGPVVYVHRFDDGLAVAGGATLRSAIAQGATRIILDAGTYLLSAEGAGEDQGITGDLDLAGQVEIIGAGASKTTVNAGRLDRAFDVRPGAQVALKRMTVSGGLAPAIDSNGGGIRNSGSLSLEECSITGNAAAGAGGGLYDAGQSTIERSAIWRNDAQLEGGGLYYAGAAASRITNCTVTENHSLFKNGTPGIGFTGGVVIAEQADVELRNCTIIDNEGAANGGLTAEGSGPVKIYNTIIVGNRESNYGHAWNVSPSDDTNQDGLPDRFQWGGVNLIYDDQAQHIGPIQDNGGPTPTCALLEGSAAIDLGPDGSDPDDPLVDQRGLTRVADGDGDGIARGDIGAYELYWGEIRGRCFDDLDADRSWDSGEPGLAGVVVYADRDNDGRRDPGEPFSVTADDDPQTVTSYEAGEYSLDELKPGTWAVRAEITSSWQTTLVGPSGIVRASVAPNGVQTSRPNEVGGISGDGRCVVFSSMDWNLTPNDQNNSTDVFIFDRQRDSLQRFTAPTISLNDTPVLRDCSGRGMSRDGSRVVFLAQPRYAVPDHPEYNAIFVYCGEDKTNPVHSICDAANNWSLFPTISPDGRYVAFESLASNLVQDDNSGMGDIFLVDLATNAVERVTMGADRVEEANQYSSASSLSNEARYVAFASQASNLVPEGDPNGLLEDVFVYDRVANKTTLVSRSADTRAGVYSSGPSITPDGRFVVFESTANDLVLGDTNGLLKDVFLYDSQANPPLRRINLTSDGRQTTTGNAWGARVSDDGRYVAYCSDASDLVPGDTNGLADVFVYDCLANTTERVSVNAQGKGGGRSQSDRGAQRRWPLCRLHLRRNQLGVR